MGLYVSTGELGGVQTVGQHLETGLPILVNVNTKDLPYWAREASHVVVITGLEVDFIVVHDPVLDEEPQRTPLQELLLAWDEQYQKYGVIGLDQIEWRHRL